MPAFSHPDCLFWFGHGSRPEKRLHDFEQELIIFWESEIEMTKIVFWECAVRNFEETKKRRVNAFFIGWQNVKIPLSHRHHRSKFYHLPLTIYHNCFREIFRNYKSSHNSLKFNFHLCVKLTFWFYIFNHTFFLPWHLSKIIQCYRIFNKD